MTASMGSSFIIALTALVLLAAFLTIVYLSNWQQNRAFRAARADHEAPPAAQALAADQEDGKPP